MGVEWKTKSLAIRLMSLHSIIFKDVVEHTTDEDHCYHCLLFKPFYCLSSTENPVVLQGTNVGQVEAIRVCDSGDLVIVRYSDSDLVFRSIAQISLETNDNKCS